MENNEKKPQFVMATFTIPIEIKSSNEIEALPDYAKVAFTQLKVMPEKQPSDHYYKLLLNVLKLTKNPPKNQPNDNSNQNESVSDNKDESVSDNKDESVSDCISPTEIKPRRSKSNIISFKNRSKYSHRNSAKLRPVSNQEDKAVDSSEL